MPLLRQDAFDAVGRIAVWYGFFTDESELDEYLSNEFGPDFGFQSAERDMSEYSVKAQFIPVRELVSEFSGSHSYTEVVVAAATIAQVASASSMLIIFDMEFDPSRVAINPLTPLTFLDNFDYTGYA